MTSNHIIIACTCGLASVYLYQTLQIPVLDTVDPLGPRAYPYLVFSGLLVSALWLAFETLHRSRLPNKAEHTSPEKGEVTTSKHGVMLTLVVGWLAIYYASIVPIGFLISSFVFLVGLTAYFNRGKWLVNTITSLVFVIGVYFLFTAVLGVPLAEGLLDL